MQRVRIEFLKGVSVVKYFDRTARNRDDANELAAEIACDSGIPHDSRRITFERKFKAVLLHQGKIVDRVESKAFDEADARSVCERWARAAGKQFDALTVHFVEGV